MITLKLRRDQARIVEKSFLPFMMRLIKAKLNIYPSASNRYLRCKILLSLIFDVEVIFRKKLATTNNNMKFKLSDAHAIAFYVFLMKLAIDTDQVYVNLIRQNLCNEIYRQLLEPVAEVEELLE